MPVKEDMPDLEDESFKEPMWEEPQVDSPSTEGHQVMPSKPKYAKMMSGIWQRCSHGFATYTLTGKKE